CSAPLADRYRAHAIPPDRSARVAEWLTLNSRAGDVVVNPHWDSFGPLFMRDSANYYLGGMDPIFQYVYSEKLFWENYYPEAEQFLVGDDRILTCPKILCRREELVDYHDALERDFGARYLLVDGRNPKLRAQLDRTDGFKPVLRTDTETL